VLNLSGNEKVLQFAHIGRTGYVMNSGTDKERAYVNFKFMFPIQKINLSGYQSMKGNKINNYQDLIRYCYDEKFGWNLELIV